jgi:PH (Pleckstrin Homology) domain-containing protein
MPQTVENYLLPHERMAIAVRRHPGVFIGHCLLLGSWCTAACLITALTDSGSLVLGVIWGVLFVLLVWLAVRATAWLDSYLVVTEIRLVFITGLVTKKAVSVPLREIARLKSRRSPLGRLVGYGEFVAEPARPGYNIPRMNYMPYMEQLQTEMRAILQLESADDAED